MAKKPQVIVQKHHVSYDPEVVYPVRKGVHQVVSLIRRFKYLTEVERHVIKLEVDLKRDFD